MGNEQNTQAAGTTQSTGWFGNVTNNLANLVGVATPVVTALSTKGTKDSNSNASTEQTAQAVRTSNNTMMLVIIGAVVLVLGGVAFLFSRKGGR